jgi:hypothetical protein
MLQSSDKRQERSNDAVIQHSKEMKQTEANSQKSDTETVEHSNSTTTDNPKRSNLTGQFTCEHLNCYKPSVRVEIELLTPWNNREILGIVTCHLSSAAWNIQKLVANM